MHLGWIVRTPLDAPPDKQNLYEVRARKTRNPDVYRVVLSPILGTREAGMPEIEVGPIMKWFSGSWTIPGDGLNYHGVRGMASSRYAAFHLLQAKGYIGWDRRC